MTPGDNKDNAASSTQPASNGDMQQEEAGEQQEGQQQQPAPAAAAAQEGMLNSVDPAVIAEGSAAVEQGVQVAAAVQADEGICNGHESQDSNMNSPSPSSGTGDSGRGRTLQSGDTASEGIKQIANTRYNVLILFLDD